MNIAEDAAQAGLIEGDVADGADRVEPEVEALPVVEREHVMEDAIVVRHLDAGADLHGEDVRRKGQIALVEDDLRGGRRRGRRWRIQPDHDVRLRVTADARRARDGTPGRGRQGAAGEQEDAAADGQRSNEVNFRDHPIQ